MITLFRKHKNNIGQWNIWSEGNVIFYSHGLVKGSQTRHHEVVTLNQSGRSLSEQIDLQIKSRISRMMDKGYKQTIGEAVSSPTNQLGLVRPMLALPINKVKNINKRNALMQRKLDGHRCLITRDGEDIIAYSRQGKLIESISHIIKPNAHLFPDGMTIDGELYCHGQKLQTLASWIKREQPNTKRLKFVAYDIVTDDSYPERLQELRSIFGQGGENIVVLGATAYESDDQMWDYFSECKTKGFEGAMLRLNGFAYADGERSASLLKLKSRHDAEFTVISIRPSKDGWAILECEIKPGLTFDVSAPGNVPEKTRVLVEQDKYIGRQVTVEYAELTNEGRPFHAVATRWREDI